MSERWNSTSNIVTITCTLAAIVVAIVDKYWGLGGLGLLFALAALVVAILLVRNKPIFPYVLLLIGVAIGLGVQLRADVEQEVPATDNGVSIPADRWKFEGEVLDSDLTSTKESIEAQVLIRSVQGQDGYTSPRQSARFALLVPAVEDGINQQPLQGIGSTIFLQPLNSAFEDEIIYCTYVMDYEGKTYASASYVVPLNQPTTIVWDFSASPDISYSSLPAEITESLDLARQGIFQDSDGFVSLVRRYAEVWRYQYQVLHNYNPTTLEAISLICNVLATRDSRNGNAGDEFSFQGRVRFSNPILYPLNESQP